MVTRVGWAIGVWMVSSHVCNALVDRLQEAGTLAPVHEMTEHSPCAPPGSTGSAVIDDRRSTKRFYLWDEGAFNMSETVGCFMELYGISSVDDAELDLRVNPGIAEHLTDLPLFVQLRRHPQRTRDPDAAYEQSGGRTHVTSRIEHACPCNR